MNTYSREFYELNAAMGDNSAAVIVPLVLQLVQPKSIVDLGCSSGVWLKKFSEAGISDFMGLDGEWVDIGQLRIPRDKFQRTDLSKPVRLGRRFDMAMSLEVAEHLPEQSAEDFVESLTKLAPVVLFSAAMPGQGGVCHINEQWADYWVEKFERRGFEVFDPIRPLIWNQPQIAAHYVQNTLLFVERSAEGSGVLIERIQKSPRPVMASVVHPRVYLSNTNPRHYSTRDVLFKWLPQFCRNKWNRYTGRLGHLFSGPSSKEGTLKES